MEGTDSQTITKVLSKISQEKRNTVKEVTLDMAKNMESIVRESFPKAKLVTDHFHVVRLVQDAMQHIRIKLRWQAIAEENEQIKKAKEDNVQYAPEVLSNGDTPKQLLARSKYLLFKLPDTWTHSQRKRSIILFRKYPILKKAYQTCNRFRSIYNYKLMSQAQAKLEQWLQDVKEQAIEEFNSVIYSIKYHQENILNFFTNRSTNANAESFNAKIKGFRAILRGVTDNKFFLFRLEKLYA